ncbi:AMP-dependent synthetase/ligase [Penicillium riverlandense]|uniref:AMP-dependent synthetase/ligase n=1 Tax=Penicillium riverlandense TaxID=1903569 RepID=UPI00254939DB|nr:AMP-dependent synthetase/ligase [Penicillium riverlandense]KAJ5814585.1 AMP-dependent synthetase/ligase [Penicillium riverlandense]
MASLTPRKLWQHPSPESTRMAHFQRELAKTAGQRLDSFQEMYLYSIQNRTAFWDFCFNYFQLIHEGSYSQVVDESARMDSVPEWFAGIRLNFAENLLFSHYAGDKTGKEDEKIAVTEVREGAAKDAVHLSWAELRRKTGVLMQAMKANGVKKGDRIALCAANSIDTLLVFLASTALGAIFSSSSTDMGVKGILDRLLQIRPRWLFMDDQAVYNGKKIDLRDKMRDIVGGMESVAEFEGIVSQPRFSSSPADINHIPKTCTLSAYLARAGPGNDRLEFERVAFRDPFLVVYSSGTTGQPKCIVHSVGGVLLNAHKEGGLHSELSPESVALQYTTTGWIMYLSAMQTLLFGSRVVLYDGSPFIPDVMALVNISAQEKVTHLGISPRWLHELQRANLKPRELVDLRALKVVTSTGMVLRDALFEWFYDDGFPSHVRLNNISGGTDLAGCFGTGNPLVPVYVGGCAGCSLGVPVEVYDSTIEGGQGVKGVPVEEGVPGELVATSAFPNMPTQFWGDDSGKKYHDAYFARFDNVWTHGDFVSIHPTTKQLMFHGRADGVLNPSGVRFGSAEIYRVIEGQFSNEIADSICVGQRRPTDTDERVLLFLLMKPGAAFTASLVERVNRAIRSELSPRHVPMFTFETPEIPTTVNLKKVELPVKQIVSGKIIQPSGTLLNPGSLEYYYQFAEVEKLSRGSKL